MKSVYKITSYASTFLKGGHSRFKDLFYTLAHKKVLCPGFRSSKHSHMITPAWIPRD